MHVAAYIEQHPGSPQTINQHLAAMKMLFDYLVISQIVPSNPAAPVKGPTHVVKRGKTPILSAEDATICLVRRVWRCVRRFRRKLIQRTLTWYVCVHLCAGQNQNH
jgi:site-specific recombinase XerD